MMKSKTKLRHGITITEVLASIGVAAVGLFGVLAVIPFAARQAEVGLDLDFAVATGKNAFHDFEARRMGDRSLWRIGYAETAGAPAADFNPSNENIDWTWDGRPVLIDPLFLQANAEFMVPLPMRDPPNPALGYFPEIDHFPLGNFVGGADSDHLFGVPSPPSTINRINVSSRSSDRTMPYNFAQAKNVFQHQDDLSFGESEDNLLLPPQNYKLINPAGSNQDVTNRMKRSSSGKISWMAMMVPEGNNPNLYRTYFIVFKNRQLLFKRDNAGEIVGERIYNATALSGGVGGGEFVLTLTSGTFAENKSPRAGDWILLTDNDENYRWYRISRTNSDNAPDQLQVSLTGADWNSANTQAIALSGVIAVYEKTIPIENNSIWNQ